MDTPNDTINSRDSSFQQLADNKAAPRWHTRLINIFRDNARSSRDIKEKKEKEELLGYRVNIKQIVLAFAIEFVIIGASLVGAYHFALIHANQSHSNFVLALLGPIGFAMVEMTRIPLAISIRTHTSWTIRLIATVGVFCAAGITAKSMVNLGQLMYEPRRAEVIRAKNELNIAAKEVALAHQQHEVLLDRIKLKKENLAQTELSVKERIDALKKNNCVPGTFQRIIEGQTLTTSGCQNSALISSLQSGLAADQKTVIADRQDLSQTETEAANFFQNSVKPTENKKMQAEFHYREVISYSQLHSLASILFGKELVDVEDSDVSYLLKFFVYVPAVLVAFASTLIAITAITRIDPPKPDHLVFPENAGAYLLGPLTAAIINEVTERLKGASQQLHNEIRSADRASQQNSPRR